MNEGERVGPDGGRYEGERIGNKQHGRGTCTYPDGDSYALSMDAARPWSAAKSMRASGLTAPEATVRQYADTEQSTRANIPTTSAMDTVSSTTITKPSTKVHGPITSGTESANIHLPAGTSGLSEGRASGVATIGMDE